MRLVGYCRVSTSKQSEHGRSIEDQERRILRWSENGGHHLVTTYREAQSAWSRRGPNGRMVESSEARLTFAQMVRELPVTRPDVVLVDSLDRFTRTLRDGLNLLEALRGHGVALLPLDLELEHPLDIDRDTDWGTVVRMFVAAEEENRARSRRMKRSYEGRRARGAVMRNVAAFGLLRDGDHYVPSEEASVICELDARYLRGDSIADIHAWIENVAPSAWRSRNGIRSALRSDHYVRAGVRTPETAAAIVSFMASRGTTHHGARRKHDHVFAGVFACGLCGGVMGEALKREGRTGKLRATIVCQSASVLRKKHPAFSVGVARIEAAWRDTLARLAVDPAAVEPWASAGDPPAKLQAQQRRLQRDRARLDQEEGALAQRRSNALSFFADSDPAVRAQARAALQEINADAIALRLRGDNIDAERLRANAAPSRNPAWLREQLDRYGEVYDAATDAQRGALNRALCAAVGSRPQLRRAAAHRWASVVIAWPGFFPSEVVCAPERTAPADDRDKVRRANRFAAGMCTRCGARPLAPGISPKTGERYASCLTCLQAGRDAHAAVKRLEATAPARAVSSVF